MSNMNFVCKLTIVIPRLFCLFSQTKAVSVTVELFKSVSSDSTNSFHFVMCAWASKWFLIKMVPYSDRWSRTWWQMIHIMQGLQDFGILQCELNCHNGTWLRSIPVVDRFLRTLREAHKALQMIWIIRLHQSWIWTHSVMENIVTYSIMVSEDYESNITVAI